MRKVGRSSKKFGRINHSVTAVKNRSIIFTLFLVCSLVVPTLTYGQLPPSDSDKVINEQILKFIEKWRQAWQNKQLDDYIDCYAENFQQDGKNLQAWRKHKENLNRRYKTIRVTLDEIKIDLHQKRANVLFYQAYRSDRYFADGNKLLVLTHTDEKGWKILKEIWLQ